MSGNGEKRPVSAGTKVMLVMLVLVIAGSALVLGRLSSGASVDLNKLNRNLLDLGRAVKDDAGDAAVKAPETQNAVYPGKDGKREGADDEAIRKAEMSETAGAAGTSSGGTVAAGTSSGGTAVAAGSSSGGTAAAGISSGGTAAVAGLSYGGTVASAGTSPGETAAAAGKTDGPGETESAGAVHAAAEPADEPASAEPRSYLLTAAGVVCLEGEVRKNSWNSESKAYDYADTMMLLRNAAPGDVKTVFLENLLMESDKYSDIIAPDYAADLLREGGFTMAACGYAQSWNKGQDGVGATRMALEERDIRPLGIRNDDDQGMLDIVPVNGIRTAFLQYTDTVAAKTRKNMEKDGALTTVPAADAGLIAREIEAARSGGAEAVVVMINWGKTGKNQKALAAEIAQAGADLIIGGGSRIPEGAEYLTGADGGKVLCIWNLGSLLTGERDNVKRMCGYLLHVEIRSNGRGGVDVLAPEYTPVYTWKYKQDGRFYYRCLAANRPAPDGMNGDQQKTMQKANSFVTETLAQSPLTQRETE